MALYGTSDERAIEMATTNAGIDRVNQETIPGADVDFHQNLDDDAENLEPTTSPGPPKRRQPFTAVWVVIACGFALMSDGFFSCETNLW
jgi:hypothetical protein